MENRDARNLHPQTQEELSKHMNRCVKNTAWPRSLLITSNDGTQSGRSGYDVLTEYIPNSKTVSYPREAPRKLFDRIHRRAISFTAASAWHLLSSRRLEKLAVEELKSGGYDLVHMLWGDRDWGCIDKICEKLSVPLILTIHACPDELDRILIHPKRLSKPNAYVLMSSHQKAFFEDRGVPHKRLWVVPHGIDTTHFKPIDNTIKDMPITVLSVGSYRRNFQLMEAVVKAMERDDRLQFIIVGRSKMGEIFSKYKNVKLLSGISDNELLKTYQNSSVFLLTAEDATANNALVEAMSCGLPVVCEKIGGLSEYAPENCALHTTPNSVDAMITALKRMIEFPELRKSMGHACRQRAKDLSWENCTEQMKVIYNKVVCST